MNTLDEFALELDDPLLPYLAGGAVTLILLFFILRMGLRRLNANKDQRQLHKAIKKASKYYLRDVTLPDGVGGLLQIDYLVLTPQGVVVINAQDFSGILFGGSNVELWTQVVRNKSYKFKNPLPHNTICVQAVRMVSHVLPVHGRIVFTSAGVFPKGVPPLVSLAHTITDDLCHGGQRPEYSADLLAKWREFTDDLARSQQSVLDAIAH